MPELAELLTRRAPLPGGGGATSWDASTRTLRAVISTGAPVQRIDARGSFIERLDVSGMRVEARVPVLAAHRAGDLRDVLGSVVATEVRAGIVEATLRLSSRDDVEAVVRDILDGHLSAISIGYVVEAWRETVDPKTAVRTKTAKVWRLLETSIVPIAADPQATIRGLPDMTTPATETVTTTPPTIDPTPPIAPETATRAAIVAIQRAAGLDDAWVESQVAAGVDVAFARTAALQAMTARSAPAASIRAHAVAEPTPQLDVAAMGEALAHRALGGELSASAARYRHASVRDLAAEIMRQHGLSVIGLSPASIVTRAAGLMSTSDLSAVVADTTARIARAAYAAPASGLRLIARAVTARDFKARYSVSLSTAPELRKVNEHGEFEYGPLATGSEAYKLSTYGRIIGITRQALVNDDLGMLTDLSRRMGEVARGTEDKLLADLIAANPLMGDGKTLFHADHGNLAASGAAIGVGSLSAARLAMRRQTGLAGEAIAATPKLLIVAPEQETAAEQVLATIYAASTGDVNPFSTKLTLVVDARLNGPAWYLSTDPAEIACLELATLEGQSGPYTETRNGFNVDGVEVKVRHDVGAGVVDYRGLFKNAGA